MTPQQPQIINETRISDVILLCDHASNHVPDDLNQLGLPQTALDDHIGWDIGAAALTKRLAKNLGIAAVLATHSRLVLDCNRDVDHPTLIPEVSDKVVIPGNVGLSAADKAARIARFHTPFHAACRQIVENHLAAGIKPLVIAVHSFTPEMDGVQRPWDAGLLWQHDDRLSQAMLGLFDRETDLHTGGQVPYTGEELFYTPGRHGQDLGLPATTLEIRNDHLRDKSHILAWARLLADMLVELTKREDLF